MNHSLPIIIASLAIVSLPLAIWIEDTAPRVWQDRLAIPHFQEEPNRHTPHYTEGTYLPPVITTDVTLNPEGGPVIITGRTQIPTNVTVTIEPGTLIVAHEFAALEVAGRLTIRGTAEQPVRFTTNERHPENQTWSGLMFMPDSTSEISHATIEYASPALTCLPASHLTARSVHTRFGLTGVYTESLTCRLSDSRLQAAEYGVVAVGVEPAIVNSIITAGRQDIKTIEQQ